MVPINEIIIVGGGKSIELGLNLPSNLSLQTVLAAKCSILCNYAYKHFNGTFLAFADREFYLPLYAKKEPNETPDIYEELGKLPLIIGLEFNPDLNDYLHPNTIMIPKSKFPDCPMTGIFALHLANLLKPKNIFLLGYDWNKRSIEDIKKEAHYDGHTDLNIHYYNKEIQHRGIGYVGFYERHNPNNYFKYFNNSKSKIYNVSSNSNIENFPKIDYPTFFKLLSKEKYNPTELREQIKELIGID